MPRTPEHGARVESSRGPHIPSIWRIDRFDLIFYNARHKRWQFFAEDPTVAEIYRTEEEGLHRYQIRSLLGAFRQAVQLALSSADHGVFEIRSYRKVARARGVRIRKPARFSEWRPYKDLYLEYLISTAWYDGVPGGHRHELKQWFDNPEQTVSREAALSFLSLLPIFEDWDTWGCFIRARNAADSRNSGAFPPPVAATWSDPFSVIELDFEPPRTAVPTKSEELLHNPVAIEGLSLDLGDMDKTIYKAPRADFFDERYCKFPKDEERLPYLFYAALVDPIMRALAGKPEPRQFLIVYPVATAGRLHFLQIALSPAKAAHHCINTLWNDWQPIHRSLWIPAFKAFLQEELHRVSASAFQSEVYDRFAGEIRQHQRSKGVPVQDCKESLYEYIYHLFPVHKVNVSNAKYYSYTPNRFPDPRHPDYETYRAAGQILSVGFKWKQLSKEQYDQISEDRCSSIVLDEARIVIPPSSPTPLHTLTENHRIQHSVQEQQRFLELLPNGLTDVQNAVDRDRLRCLKIVLAFAKRSRAQELAILSATGDVPDAEGIVPVSELTTDSGEPLELPAGRPDYRFRYTPHSFRRFLSQAFETMVPLAQLQQLKRHLSPPLLLRLSEYFETGPAKLLTHTYDSQYFNGSYEDVLAATTKYYSVLFDGINADLERVGSLQDIPAFHQHCVATCRPLKALPVLDDFCCIEGRPRIREIGRPTISGCPRGTAASARDCFERATVTVSGKELRMPNGFRFYGLDPGPLISSVLAHAGVLEAPLESWWVNAGTRYTSQYYTETEYQVFLIDHYILAPIRIDDVNNFARGNARTALEGWLLCGHCWYVTGSDAEARRFVSSPDGPVANPDSLVIGRLPESGLRRGLLFQLQHWKMDESSGTADWLNYDIGTHN